MFVASVYPSLSIFLLPLPAATRKRLQTSVSAHLRPITSTGNDEKINQNNVGSITHAASSKPVKPVSRESKQQQLLSGSDVLRALNKAATDKAKANAKKKNQKATTTGAAKIISGKGGAGTETIPDDVAPLRVKDDWGVRLEQLQNRLDHLKLETI